MIAQTIVDQVLDELRDGNARKYSRTSILTKLNEAQTQFVRESSILKHSISYSLLEEKSLYPLPEGLTNFSGDWDFATAGTGVADDTFAIAANNEVGVSPGVVIGTGSATTPTAFYKYLGSKRYPATSGSQTITFKDSPAATLQIESILIGGNLNTSYWKVYYTPAYLKAIRFGLLSVDEETERILTPNSEYERDLVGMNRIKTGTPNYVYNDNLNFYSFGIWPSPDSTCIDNYYDTLKLDYVYDAETISTENDALDSGIPTQFLDKLYILVCYLRLNASIEETDQIKAPLYKELYQRDLLAPALAASGHIDRYDQLRVMT